MEEYLIDTISQNLSKNENLKVRVVMDAYRGQRLSKPGSESIHSFDMVSRLKVVHINRDVDVGLYKMNPPYWFTNMLKATQINELNGVHHIKFAVFDNSVILTGANFEEQYFLNRNDRYWIINDAEALANYLEDVAGSLLTASDTSTPLNGVDLAYKSSKVLSWKKSMEYMKRQDRVLGYSHFVTTKRFESKDTLGVIEPRQYAEKPALEASQTTAIAQVQPEELARTIANQH